MLFKDHLKLVTDAGAVLHLGWDYNAPYNLDPLNGVDVDIQTAQGINQTGTTVERQSVAGVSRTLSVGPAAPSTMPAILPGNCPITPPARCTSGMRISRASWCRKRPTFPATPSRAVS